MKVSRIILIIALLIVAFLLYHSGANITGSDSKQAVEAQQFSGTLTEFNSGCFADAECYAVVDGVHVTILRGWSQETVGSVIGTDDGIGGLSSHIGEEVEVYALPETEERFTLYGSEDYYIKVQ